MTDLYLIAHKVRGEAAFDIAERFACSVCDIGAPAGPGCEACGFTGSWWIVSTSGNRAYPYWKELLCTKRSADGYLIFMKLQHVPPPPPNLPDHYACNNKDHKPLKEAAVDLLKALGLGRRQTEIKRRV